MQPINRERRRLSALEPRHGLDDYEGGSGAVVEQRLAQLVRQQTAIVDRQFELTFLYADAEAFSFTFG